MITIQSYRKIIDDDCDTDVSYYKVNITIDGLVHICPIPMALCETAGIWDESKAQIYLDAHEAAILESAQVNLETAGLIHLNRSTNEIEFAVPTKEAKSLETRIAALEAAVAEPEKP